MGRYLVVHLVASFGTAVRFEAFLPSAAAMRQAAHFEEKNASSKAHASIHDEVADLDEAIKMDLKEEERDKSLQEPREVLRESSGAAKLHAWLQPRLAALGTFRFRDGASLTDLQASARVASGDFLSKLIEEPDFLLLVIYLGFAAVVGIKQGMNASSEWVEARTRVRAQRDALRGAYQKSVEDVEEVLAGMAESAAYLAEWNFEEKRAKFQKFVEKVRDQPMVFAASKDVATMIADPMRTFLGMWLSIFEQCSANPIDNPKVIATQSELNRCSTVVDLTGFVADRLSKHSVTSMQVIIQRLTKKDKELEAQADQDPRWLEVGNFGFGYQRGHGQRGQEVEEESEEEDDAIKQVVTPRATSRAPPQQSGQYPIDIRMGLLRLVVLSPSHLLSLGAFALGWLALAAHAVLGHTSILAVIFVVQAVLALLLYYTSGLEEVARLELDIIKLEAANEEAKDNHEQLKDFYGKVRKLGMLWRYRTLPCLEHFHELQLALVGTEAAQKVEFLEAINDVWQPKLAGLGEITDWIGEDSISEEFLKLASSQLSLATEYVTKHQGKEITTLATRINNAFGFLVVRILCAFNLKNKGPLGQLSNPYCIISIDQKGGKEVGKTKAVSADLNPRWGEEVAIPIAWTASMVEFEVLDDQKMGRDNHSLGYIDVKFRDQEPGKWIRRRQHLTSKKKQTEQKAELVYEIFYADELRQLRGLGGADPTASRAP